MKRVIVATLVLAGLMGSGKAWAQDTSTPPPEEVRPAIATYWGDTGLWFVPTAEVLRSRGWSFGVYHTELDFNQGFTNVSFYPVTLAVGLGSRVEAFGSFRAVTRIDRDRRPLFTPRSEEAGGVLNDFPYVNDTWSGNEFGDLFLGAKINLVSEHRNEPFAMAFRGTVKLPTANADEGAGTGEVDYFGDLIIGKEISRTVELTAFGGYAYRGDPEFIKLSNSVRWGAGAAFGSQSTFRVTTELHGETPVDENLVVTPGLIIGTDGSTSPIATPLDTIMNAAVGFTYQHPKGMSFGVGVNYRFGLDKRSEVSPELNDKSGDALALQFRLGFHPGVRIYVPPPPPRVVEAPPPTPQPAPPVVEAPRPAPAPVPPPNRTPTVRAQCDPCRVEVGQSIAVSAEGVDADGDTLNASWTASSGTIANPRATATRWTAETVPGNSLLTVTIDDGKGGTASVGMTIEVVRPPLRTFGDVLFEVNRSDLGPNAITILNAVLQELTNRPTVRLLLEGHASDEGAAAYNRALGERRAAAVRNYLVGRGLNQARLGTISYGEERPKTDASAAETRRLSRRVVLVIEGQ